MQFRANVTQKKTLLERFSFNHYFFTTNTHSTGTYNRWVTQSFVFFFCLLCLLCLSIVRRAILCISCTQSLLLKRVLDIVDSKKIEFHVYGTKILSHWLCPNARAHARGERTNMCGDWWLTFSVFHLIRMPFFHSDDE